ncbi:MAG: Fpg/Nei family DNA glycosylase [Desulfatibacillaceae bacterium]
MPELPDVETYRKYLEATALHKAIVKVSVETDLLAGVSEKELSKTLNNAKLENTRRHGKHLFIRTSKGPWVGLHFGMTGFLKYYEKPEEKPEHVRLLLAFSNGYRLAYDCQRKLGAIRIIDDPDEFIEDNDLGPDALADDMDFETFRDIIRGSRGYIKSTLMSQKDIAGLGNVWSDEILYQAGIHPKKKIGQLDDGQLRKLYDTMLDVLDKGIRAGGDTAKMPDGFLTPLRGTDSECPCGGKVEKISVSGRNAVYCPRCQT